MIAAYIDRYHHRPHNGLNYRTPAEVAQTWNDDLESDKPTRPERGRSVWREIYALAEPSRGLPTSFGGRRSAGATGRSVPLGRRNLAAGGVHAGAASL